MRQWPTFTFATLKATLTKRFKVAIPVTERDEWERWFEEKRREAARLASRINEIEGEIDARVYRLFDLAPTEVAAIEDALRIASSSLSIDSYEAISAIEGLELSVDARERLTEKNRKRHLAA
jgi:hypothetical protein